MSTPNPPSNDLPLEAYKVLVGMLQSDDNLFWRRNDVLIAINGGLLTVIGLMRSSATLAAAPSGKAISIAIAIIAVVVCLLWFAIVKRSESFYNHWFEQIMFIEETYLKPLEVFQKADEFFARGVVQLGKKTFKLDFFSRSLHMYTAMQVLALIFAFVWLCLGVYFIIYT